MARAVDRPNIPAPMMITFDGNVARSIFQSDAILALMESFSNSFGVFLLFFLPWFIYFLPRLLRASGVLMSDSKIATYFERIGQWAD
jgi:hypothetical protein